MLKTGEIYSGTVTKIFPTFIIINVNGVSGICHISEISDYLVSDVHDFFDINKTYNFKLMSFDEKQNKYFFSYKRINAKLLKKRNSIIPTASGFKNVIADLNKHLQ
jgi:predicted RNA-binding protein with RPS1 domain